jgi:L,D-peptidoglycan transpeptidase YkuD (ErfK/YbiS/YcfS/YnhG family)
VSVRSLRQEEAVERAALLSVTSYDIAIDLTDLVDGPAFRAVSTIRFTATAGASTFVDCCAEVESATLNGESLPAAEDGRIGYGGLVLPTKRKQGTGSTPLGTYALPWAFGNGPGDERWRLRYREVQSGDFWVQDNESAHYNRYRNQADGGFRWWLPTSDPDSSERLSDFGRQYRISVVTDFNIRQARHRGAGIFLHVNGSGATAGCVSAPGVFMDKLMRVLHPARVPVIAVGR